jgi:hypothetical protein
MNNINTGINLWYGASNSIYNNLNCYNNLNMGIYLNMCGSNIIKNSKFNLNSTYGIQFAQATTNKLMSCSTSGNITNGIYSYLSCGENYLFNYIGYEASPIAFATSFYDNSRINSQNHNNTANNHIIFTDLGTIYNTTSVRYTNSGFAWAMAPTSTNRDSTYPLNLKIATVAVNANSLVTVKAWMRRNNLGLTIGLRIKANQIGGVSNDITSYASGVADNWEQVTLNFTPTEAGVVEILAECWGGTTNIGYVDNITITQI